VSRLLEKINHTLKLLLSVLVVILFSLKASGQSSNLDRLVSLVKNDSLVGYCQWIWRIDLKCNAGNSLINEAQQIHEDDRKSLITSKLLSLLTDSTQGIAVHYVLTSIWCKFVSRRDGGVAGPGSTIEYTYNNLTFYQSNGRYFASQAELATNKERWLEFLR
jgi:hypothetical protein